MAPEAILSVIYSMLAERVRSKGTTGLRQMGPLATYILLAPFLGPDEACEITNGGTPMGSVKQPAS